MTWSMGRPRRSDCRHFQDRAAGWVHPRDDTLLVDGDQSAADIVQDIPHLGAGLTNLQDVAELQSLPFGPADRPGPRYHAHHQENAHVGGRHHDRPSLQIGGARLGSRQHPAQSQPEVPAPGGDGGHAGDHHGPAAAQKIGPQDDGDAEHQRETRKRALRKSEPAV